MSKWITLPPARNDGIKKGIKWIALILTRCVVVFYDIRHCEDSERSEEDVAIYFRTFSRSSKRPLRHSAYPVTE